MSDIIRLDTDQLYAILAAILVLAGYETKEAIKQALVIIKETGTERKANLDKIEQFRMNWWRFPWCGQSLSGSHNG